MRVSMVELIIDAKRKDIEDALNSSEFVDDFEIEDLDDKDIRKCVVVFFKELVDSKFLDEVLKKIFPFEEIKQTFEE